MPGSQQPLWQGVDPVQHAPPVKPQLVLPASKEVSPHDDDAEPEMDCVGPPPCEQLMLQLEPLVVDVQVAPPADSVPHRQSVAPPWATVQHAEGPVFDDEQPTGMAMPSASRNQRVRIPRRYPGAGWSGNPGGGTLPTP